MTQIKQASHFGKEKKERMIKLWQDQKQQELIL